MKYPFPIIRHINDVLPAIEDSPEFYVSDKGDYKVINYQVSFSDSFPPIYDENGEYDLNAAVRRECRGIIFDSAGYIIRRPYHKFFNHGEKQETLGISLADHHHILAKLDGSMIAPFLTREGELIWGTKMGETDVSVPAQLFAQTHCTIEYVQFSLVVLAHGLTPIFEWCSRKQKIVLDYPEDQLILTGLRNIYTGEYDSYDSMKEFASAYGIPVVGLLDSISELEDLVSHTRDLKDAEGFVVRFDHGGMVKLKGQWYVDIHKAKESILWDRNVVEKILDNTIDDIKPHLLPEDLNRLEGFEKDFHQYVNESLEALVYLADDIVKNELDKKRFALEVAPNIKPLYKTIIFSTWLDGHTSENLYTELIKSIKKNLNSNTNYEVLRDSILGGIKYNV